MAADTIRFIVTVAIVVYKGLIPVVGRMLTYLTHPLLYYNSVMIMFLVNSKKGGYVETL